ncbi:ankyrin repeat domain-containing protein [Nocardioides alcanivorans]|uniref:ankyrin repeat domain-containing protein n=1 Tax=Nocardioides alcanivorans TaxID=2897352 RepID=UPI001F3D4C6E|nr:ankyrin repeat domain-containing protein [Nocardioides alcanivorans]
MVALALELARTGNTSELVEFLDHRLPVDTQGDDGQSLLMLAAYHGHMATVRALIERGADLDLLNARDQSPLAGALFKGEDEVARALIEAGASLDTGTPTAREAARMFGRAHLLL